MPTQLQIRRGSTTDHNSFTGAAGELTVDTTKDTLRVHDGSTAGGFELARADGSNLNNITSNITFADNSKAIFGTGSDLEIYHDGANSYIKETGTGSLYLDADAFVLRNNADSGKWINCYGDTVVLNYNNSAKLTTTSKGIDVTGTATIDGGTGSATAGGTLVVRQKGDTSADGIALTSSNSVSHRIWKDASGNLNIGSSSFPSSFVQDFNGNVGIGTSSPAAMLNTKGDDALLLESTGSDNYGFHVTVDYCTDMVKLGALDSADGSKDGSTITFGDFGRDIQFSTNKGASLSEAMRITSDGNLLVSKTASSLTAVGCQLQATGLVRATVDGADVLQLNRKTSDGSIASFYKDGTTVGSIGTNSGSLFIGSGDTGLNFRGDLDSIYPWGPSGGARADAIDLGYSTVPFKDLYLSGGAYLGGTTAANKLDDYEEGTFTVAVEGSTTAGTGTYATRNARYTKIGNVVHVRMYINMVAHTGAGNFLITGLPFNAKNASNEFFTASIDFSNGISKTADNYIYGLLRPNTSQIEVKRQPTSGTSTVWNLDVPLDTAFQAALNLTYVTD